MERTLTLKGVNGSVRWSYHIAAVLQNWSVTPKPDKAFALKATVTARDAFKLTQRPLVFVVPLKGGDQEWPITHVKISGDTLTATLAARTPQETP